MFKRNAFTLAEILVALAILGAIAAFTIPKVLQAQQDSEFKSIAKAGVAMVSAAYAAYQMDNTPSTSTKIASLTPFMNYVKIDSTSTIDNIQGYGSTSCAGPNWICLRLHSGATLRYDHLGSDGMGPPLDSKAATWFDIDPDGKVTDGTTNGPGKGVQFFLYSTGRIATFGTMEPNTISHGNTLNPDPTRDPPWFSWE